MDSDIDKEMLDIASSKKLLSPLLNIVIEYLRPKLLTCHRYRGDKLVETTVIGYELGNSYCYHHQYNIISEGVSLALGTLDTKTSVIDPINPNDDNVRKAIF